MTDRPLVESYFRRIGIERPERADLEGLRAIHAAHVAAIPFENLDILLGRGIRLDLDHLCAKLIDARRGGYCFEQNSLLMAVLGELGFIVSPMEARVRVGATGIRPRTHMVLVADIAGDAWLVDVGFGGEGPLEPVPMSGEPSVQGPLSYRVVADPLQAEVTRVKEENRPARVLQMRSAADWIDQYAFLPQPVQPIDFELANWYTSTYPESPFVRILTAQRTTRDVRYLLRYPTYSEIRGVDVRSREISRDELLPLLREAFHIDLPDGTSFPAID